MPYRSEPDAERRLAEAERRFQEADKRVRATAAGLRRLTARFERELAEAEHAVAHAEAACRAELRRALAVDGGSREGVRTQLRSAGVIAALEKAMRQRQPVSAPPPERTAPRRGPADATARERLAHARRARARLISQRDPTLDAAKARLEAATVAYDEAQHALEAARARIAPP